MALTTLISGAATLKLSPNMGGAIASLSYNGLPILREWSGKETDGPFSLASNILIPFSNRISKEIIWNGIKFSIPPTVQGEPLPLHGDAFKKKWHLDGSSNAAANLILKHGELGPFKYAASQRFTLKDHSLTIDLSITNEAEIQLPYGFGFHPWFPRNSETKLRFKASKIGVQNNQNLPERYVSLCSVDEMNFHEFHHLPSSLINNDFLGWDGIADIHQGKNAKSVRITVSDLLNIPIIYSPNGNADFFCFEPVSHPINAFNHPGVPGLIPLSPNETVRSWIRFEW
ncbi:aldose 1-epimerase [Hirschia maritima]|uniref:aldose 1-epimerase n=1 Tax=Hirschia maritima TaxID=1121961 RepID=UPI00039C627A|nr:aldose 1-epimerase [Hirschia maritima]